MYFLSNMSFLGVERKSITFILRSPNMYMGSDKSPIEDKLALVLLKFSSFDSISNSFAIAISLLIAASNCSNPSNFFSGLKYPTKPDENAKLHNEEIG